ncbi:hypothetical protein SOVF_134000 [Spinacia oleracea]|nr:hypothetical protein SOVF_134000 [Spinacia oleracea]
MAETTFSKLSDDVTLKIFSLLEDDPRNWARLSCVCRKFNSIITSTCCKSKCLYSFPSISADLLPVSSLDGWASLYKIAVCCPGLQHAGVLFDNSHFGLDRELGPTEEYLHLQTQTRTETETNTTLLSSPPSSSKSPATTVTEVGEAVVHDDDDDDNNNNNIEFGGWSLYDDLYFDTIYDNSETATPMEVTTGVADLDSKFVVTTNPILEEEDDFESKFVVTKLENDEGVKRRKVNVSRLQRSHLASGVWNLSREQGNKLLASRFRDDCLYISDWPGCVHIEEKRSYMLFRGVFKNFKRTRVWRTINDGNRSKIVLNCAFCSCNEVWDLHSAFCLKRGFGFHDDGEPVVRAYVCENGHVSGAWTDLPLYT